MATRMLSCNPKRSTCLLPMFAAGGRQEETPEQRTKKRRDNRKHKREEETEEQRHSKIRKQRLDDQRVRGARLAQMREHARSMHGKKTVESCESRLKRESMRRVHVVNRAGTNERVRGECT